VAPSSGLRLQHGFLTQSSDCRPTRRSVQPPRPNAGRLWQVSGFRLLPFRSPLLREYSLFLGVLRCFSSPGSLPAPMDSVQDDAVSPAPGCPIRIPSDQCVPAAPRGVSSRGHVLHRPHAPRHPPCALCRSCTSVVRCFAFVLQVTCTHRSSRDPLMRTDVVPSARHRCRRCGVTRLLTW
jgi:hypothetical protein